MICLKLIKYEYFHSLDNVGPGSDASLWKYKLYTFAGKC